MYVNFMKIEILPVNIQRSYFIYLLKLTTEQFLRSPPIELTAYLSQKEIKYLKRDLRQALSLLDSNKKVSNTLARLNKWHYDLMHKHMLNKEKEDWYKLGNGLHALLDCYCHIFLQIIQSGECIWCKTKINRGLYAKLFNNQFRLITTIIE